MASDREWKDHKYTSKVWNKGKWIYEYAQDKVKAANDKITGRSALDKAKQNADDAYDKYQSNLKANSSNVDAYKKQIADDIRKANVSANKAKYSMNTANVTYENYKGAGKNNEKILNRRKNPDDSYSLTDSEVSKLYSNSKLIGENRDIYKTALTNAKGYSQETKNAKSELDHDKKMYKFFSDRKDSEEKEDRENFSKSYSDYKKAYDSYEKNPVRKAEAAVSSAGNVVKDSFSRAVDVTKDLVMDDMKERQDNIDFFNSLFEAAKEEVKKKKK